MIWDFLGAAASGLGLLGLALFVNRLILRNYFGGWLYPATAAAGMILFTIWSEYSWPHRVIASQPHLILASQNDHSVAYRPWTMIWPQHNRLVTVNSSQTHTHPAQPHLVLTQLVLLARWEPVRAVLAVFDCQAGASAVLDSDTQLNPDGTLEGVTWTVMEQGDPVLATVCASVGEGPDERGNGP